MSKRVMFYSHDTFGLGHIRRTQKIANSVSDGEKSILIACSSPMANSFSSRPGIEYLSLPGFTKQVNGEYSPRSLRVPLEEFVALRANLLLAAVQSFRPQVLVVDKEPLGVKGELIPSLKFLREHSPGTKIVCGFRDILDEKSVVEEEWNRKGTVKVLEEFYDSILIYGDQENLDFVQEYSLPESLAKKVVYTGYVQPKNDGQLKPFAISFPKDWPLVTFTLGGGGDGWSYIDTYLSSVENNLAQEELNFLLLTGPFADPALVARAERLAASRPNFKVLSFTDNVLGLFAKSRLVISMGGYNSVCELLQLGKFPLLLPRIVPREEQLIRARVFQQKGYCDFIHPSELNASVLAQKIRELTQGGRPATPKFSSNGIENVSRFIEELLACPSASFSKVIPA